MIQHDRLVSLVPFSSIIQILKGSSTGRKSSLTPRNRCSFSSSYLNPFLTCSVLLNGPPYANEESVHNIHCTHVTRYVTVRKITKLSGETPVSEKEHSDEIVISYFYTFLTVYVYFHVLNY